MSGILDPPATVLFAGVDEETVTALTEELLQGAAESVRTVTATDEAVDQFSGEGSIGAVVTAPSLADGSGFDLCRAIRRRDEDLPVLLYADDVRTELLREALDAGVTDVLPQSETAAATRATVDDALTTYRQRRVISEESEMLTEMLNSLDKSIYVKDRDLRIIHHADVGGGLDPAEARGKTDLELYDDEESAQQAYADGMRVIEGEQIIDREERIQENDLWMRTTKVPWRDDDGEVKGLIGHTIDITEYKRKERELEELRHRFTTFTRQLQHDLKTQIQIAFGLLDRIERGGDDQVVQLERTLARIDQIVDDYDKLAKRSITIDDEVTPTDLQTRVEGALAVVDTEGVAVEVDVAPETYVNAPNSMVQTVLVNLLRDATNHVDAEDTVRVGTTYDGFYVEDTSGEIPEFKREVLDHAGYTSTQDGSGRELSIVKDQIERHIWSLSLGESREGGARIEVGNCLVDDDTGRSANPVPLEDRAVIGHLERLPSATYDENANRWSVVADGNDVFRQDNDFFFVHATVEGPVSIQGKVHGVEHVADFSKGGLMIRDSLAPDATYGYLGKTPAFGSELLWRSETGADGQSRQLMEQATLFDWYRLDRVGDEVRMSLSMDGDQWQEIDRRQIAGDDPVHVGLVVCSAIPGETCEAVFEDVAVRELGEK